MKKVWWMTVLVLWGCQKNEVASVYTGNQAMYGLVAPTNSAYNVSGTATFKERKDGSTTILVQLSGSALSGSVAQLPVHLHLGDVSANGAAIAALLNPDNAKTGTSETTISQLADGTKVAYKDLLNLSAYINVHAAATGPESAVILAAGNIGANGTKTSSNLQIGVCKIQ